MKRTFLYLFAMLLVGATLSSCLGDNESSYEGKSYGVVTDIDGTKVVLFAINNAGYAATADNLSGYSKGDIIGMDYKINFGNMNNSGIIKADYIGISESFRAEGHESVRSEAVPENIGEHKLTSLSISLFATNAYYLDKWLFVYSYERKKGEEADGLRFYYDAENQEEVEDAENTYIIDVRLKVDGSATGTDVTTTEGGTGVDFTSFRTLVKPKTIDGEGTSVNVWFRYYKSNDSKSTLLKGASLFYTKES